MSLLLLLAAVPSSFGKKGETSFEIKDNMFLINGKPFQFICGEMHYLRIPYVSSG